MICEECEVNEVVLEDCDICPACAPNEAMADVDYCKYCGQVEWFCICAPYCGDHLVPLNQCNCKP